ncbi:MAG: HNH endonuclease signature motif containing protein [Verrucomicrobiales bacterium]|nr:HNH endonuclease signature motif containing protein [Verrucomicrobiales bacterium]
MAISKRDRIDAIERAAARCEYCQTPLDYTPDPLVIDHAIPLVKDGTDRLDNLVVCCWGCNGHKFTSTTAYDIETATIVDLFNPRIHEWNEHFRWSNDSTFIEGSSPVGRASIDKLNLNRDGLLNLRSVLKVVGLHPPK